MVLFFSSRNVYFTHLISSFSRGLLSSTTHGRSDSAGFVAGRGGDFEGDPLPRIFRLVFGVASLFWTRWGNRMRRICSRSSSTIFDIEKEVFMNKKKHSPVISSSMNNIQYFTVSIREEIWIKKVGHLVPGVSQSSYGKTQSQHHAGSFRDQTHQVEGDRRKLGATVRIILIQTL